MNSIVDLLTISTNGPVSFDSRQLFSDGHKPEWQFKWIFFGTDWLNDMLADEIKLFRKYRIIISW